MGYADPIERAKANAALKAMEYIVEARVIGVGTGSTVEKLVDAIRARRSMFKDKVFTGSSYDTLLKLAEAGLTVVYPGLVERVDVYVDGADEVDPMLNMVKGGGAALSLEKILAYYAAKRVFIVDYTKLVPRLGEKHPVPVDVIPWAIRPVLRMLKEMGYKAWVRASGGGKYGPVVSDIGGIIVDVAMPPDKDPRAVDDEIRGLPGVIETGLFLGVADVVIVGREDGAEVRVNSGE